MPSLPRVHLALTLALAAALLAPAALAQTPVAPVVQLTLDSTTLDLGAGNTTEITGTVSNPGTLQGTVTLAVETLDGWTVTVDPASAFTLNGGASAPVTLLFVAPAAATGAASGDVGLTATIADQAGQTSTAAASVAVTRVDPVIPPPPTPWYQTTGGIAAIVGAVLLVVGALSAVLVSRNRRLRREAEEQAAAERAAYLARETGVTLSIHTPLRPYGLKREMTGKVFVENTSDRPRVALVRVVEAPAGWRASLSVPKLAVSPGEKAIVTIHAQPDATVAAGVLGRIELGVKPEEAVEREERLVLDANAALLPIPEAAKSPPDVRLRQAGGSRFTLRR